MYQYVPVCTDIDMYGTGQYMTVQDSTGQYRQRYRAVHDGTRQYNQRFIAVQGGTGQYMTVQSGTGKVQGGTGRYSTLFVLVHVSTDRYVLVRTVMSTVNSGLIRSCSPAEFAAAILPC